MDVVATSARIMINLLFRLLRFCAGCCGRRSGSRTGIICKRKLTARVSCAVLLCLVALYSYGCSHQLADQEAASYPAVEGAESSTRMPQGQRMLSSSLADRSVPANDDDGARWEMGKPARCWSGTQAPGTTHSFFLRPLTTPTPFVVSGLFMVAPVGAHCACPLRLQLPSKVATLAWIIKLARLAATYGFVVIDYDNRRYCKRCTPCGA